MAQKVPTSEAMKRTRIVAPGETSWREYWSTNQASMPQMGIKVGIWRPRRRGKKILEMAMADDGVAQRRKEGDGMWMWRI